MPTTTSKGAQDLNDPKFLRYIQGIVQKAVEQQAGSMQLLTVEEAARELQIARRRIFEMIADGTLPSLKIGKSRRITRAALEEYIRRMEQ